ncbi:hypothetical protein GCM10020367_16350 [Streptomyces sannanensis]|uniref:DUF4034 domain-containing protein n=2 Tax=Streptomyces sannanensis TaxID=285536 RepID=A0ABP6S824_9ACTN
MPFLRALIGTARRLHAPRERLRGACRGCAPEPPAAGLPSDDEVLLDAPDERLGPALIGAALGDHERAAKLLAVTRDAAEWEDRDRYVARLAAFADHRDQWLTDWLAAAPGDPDALLLTAELALRRAWNAPARAERLREVGPLIEAAVDAGPRDPVPWRLALDHARGSGTAHTAFERLWEAAVRRSSHHYGCHVAALKYLGAHGGSYGECLDFAEQAADDALPGSLVQALPLRAAFACLASGESGTAPAARLDAAADRGIALCAGHPAGEPRPAEVRNLLAYVLSGRERRADALEQFRLIGRYATSFPWISLGGDPLSRFLEQRAAASRTSRPGREKPGHQCSGAYYA